MIVELIGLPSSGKTTFIKQLQKHHRGALEIKHPLNELYSKSWFFRNIIKTKFLLTNIYRNKENIYECIKIFNSVEGVKKSESFKRMFNNIFYTVFYNSIQKNENKIYMFDEGILHHCWATYLNNNSEEVTDFSTAINLVEPSQLLIYIRMDKDIAVERNMNRNIKNNRKNKLNKRHLELLANINEEIQKMDLIVKKHKENNPNKNILIIDVKDIDELNLDTFSNKYLK